MQILQDVYGTISEGIAVFWNQNFLFVKFQNSDTVLTPDFKLDISHEV